MPHITKRMSYSESARPKTSWYRSWKTGKPKIGKKTGGEVKPVGEYLYNHYQITKSIAIPSLHKVISPERETICP